MGVFLGVAKIPNNFFGVLEISDIFGGLTVDAGREPTYICMQKRCEYPPPWGGACLVSITQIKLKFNLHLLKNKKSIYIHLNFIA